MKDAYTQALARLGFTDKEAKVYVAALELGPAPMQKIAERAGVKRATTYVMVEMLMARGLMTEKVNGKRAVFVAEGPHKLHEVLENERKAIEAKKEVVNEVLPGLLKLLPTEVAELERVAA